MARVDWDTAEAEWQDACAWDPCGDLDCGSRRETASASHASLPCSAPCRCSAYPTAAVVLSVQALPNRLRQAQLTDASQQNACAWVGRETASASTTLCIVDAAAVKRPDLQPILDAVSDSCQEVITRAMSVTMHWAQACRRRASVIRGPCRC